MLSSSRTVFLLTFGTHLLDAAAFLFVYNSLLILAALKDQYRILCAILALSLTCLMCTSINMKRNGESFATVKLLSISNVLYRLKTRIISVFENAQMLLVLNRLIVLTTRMSLRTLI